MRDVLDDAARERLVDNIVGHLKDGVSEPVLNCALEYWRNVERNIGDRIAPSLTNEQKLQRFTNLNVVLSEPES